MTARSQKRDAVTLCALLDELRTLKIGELDFVPRFIDDLRQLLGPSSTDGYGFERCVDAASLLGWVETYASAPFDERQRVLLDALMPALQERLRVELRLERGSRASMLDLALQSIASAALIIDADGAVLQANDVARSMLDAPAATLREDLGSIARSKGDHPDWSISSIETNGRNTTMLVVSRHPNTADLAGGRLALAERRWQLSPQQSRVLAKVADGTPNRTIAAMLEISERTVEAHVTALLAKAEVENRAELVAKLWTMD
jgi:DNA-binding CsgD family transcriptional regulator